MSKTYNEYFKDRTSEDLLEEYIGLKSAIKSGCYNSKDIILSMKIENEFDKRNYDIKGMEDC